MITELRSQRYSPPEMNAFVRPSLMAVFPRPEVLQRDGALETITSQASAPVLWRLDD